MADADLIKLYSQRILALAADIPHSERLATPQASAYKRSPLCGSNITVDVVLDAAGALAQLGMDVKACALGQASASLLGREALGLTQEALTTKREALRMFLKGEHPEEGDIASAQQLFEVLTPAIDYKNRHASIMLAWEAVVEAMAQATQSNINNT